MEIKVPALGESITEATISRWLKKQGEAIQEDDPLVELETDKITVEVNAPGSGVLTDIIAQEGDDVDVGSVIGILDATATPTVQSAPAEEPVAIKVAPPAPASVAPAEKIMSPAAHKIARERDINPAHVAGTGKDDRLTKGDMLSHAPKRAAVQEPSEERRPMSRLRQRIAERLKESQNTAAMLTTFNEVDMTHVMALRGRFKEAFEKEHGAKLGFMSFFTKAVIAALKKVPVINAEIDGTDVIYKSIYNIGVAVGTESGLVVPVIKDAAGLSFAEIEQTINHLGARARSGALSIDDLSGGTFTISNGGVYGSLLSTPIVNPPQSGILGLHKIEKRAVVVNDEIVIRPMMYTALTYDHRLVDGKEAVTFLVHIKDYIEDPERLLLDL